MFKVNNKETYTAPLPSFWYLYCYVEHISHFALVFLLTLSRYAPAGNDPLQILENIPLQANVPILTVSQLTGFCMAAK